LLPIFIVGFPRSGTTLLEQILASHTTINAGDELVFMEDVRNRVAIETGSKKLYPACLLDKKLPLSHECIDRLRQFYLDRVIEQRFITDDKVTIFTDKMPHNIYNLGLISILFPEAPIIHIIRHPMDACLSAFMANFSSGHRYTESMQNTATHYAVFMKLAEHFKSVLDMNYMQIRYEDLIDNTEEGARKVLDFVGVAWEDECLKFYENKRVSRTASYAQVTQKIYTSSRYRYKNYYQQMEPYAEILAEAMENFGYKFEP